MLAFLSRAGSEPRLRRLVMVCILAIVALLMVARKPEAILQPRFFAEDAIIFFNQDRQLGINALFQPYAGYHHLLVRIAAFLVGFLDPVFAPLLYATIAWFVIVGVAAICFAARTRLGFACRSMLALSIAFVPHGGEALLILTNIQWILAPALLLIMLQEPPTIMLGEVGWLCLIALAGLNGPFIATFAVVVIGKVAMERDFSRYRLIVLGIALCAALIQLRGLLGRDSAKKAAELSAWFHEPAEHLIGKLFYGPSFLINPLIYSWFYVVVAAIGVGLLVIGAVRARKLLVVYLLFAALLLLAAGYYTMREAPQTIDPFEGANRYTLPPIILVMWSLVIYAFEVTKARVTRGLIAVALVGMATSAMMHFRVEMRSNEWPVYLNRYKQGQSVPVPIDPEGWAFGIAPRHP